MGRWKYVILGIIIMMFLGTVYSYGVFRLSLEQMFRIEAIESGMPYMMALAFYSLFMFLTGKYLEKFSPRVIMLAGGILVSIGWILSSFAPNIMILTITYGCISGAGVGITYGVPMTIVTKWFPEKKGLAVGMVLLGFGLSPLITAPLASILVENYGVMNTFLALGLGFGIVLPILIYPFKYPTELDLAQLKHKKVIHSNLNNLDIAGMVKTKSFRGLYLNFIIGTMIGLMIIGMTTNIGVEFCGITSRSGTRLLAVFAVFNGLGRPVFGWITDRLSSKKSMLLSYFLISLAAVLLIIAGKDNELIYIISFSIFWFNLGGWLAIAPASTLRLYGMKNYSRNYGLVFTAYGIGAIIGVSSSGLLLDLLGSYHFVFYYIIALCVIGVVLTMGLISNENILK